MPARSEAPAHFAPGLGVVDLEADGVIEPLAHLADVRIAEGHLHHAAGRQRSARVQFPGGGEVLPSRSQVVAEAAPARFRDRVYIPATPGLPRLGDLVLAL